MTREETIEILTRHRDRHFSDFGWDKSVYKALDMAIQALSQEPCTDAVPMSVIKDIKAEIQDKQWFFTSIIVNHVIAIIDKHIKE